MKVRNINYQKVCLPCLRDGKVVKYLGESHKTTWERGWNHREDARRGLEGAHMLIHAEMEDPGENPNKISKWGSYPHTSSPQTAKY